MATKGKNATSGSKLPDLYQLLNLEPLEDNRERIETALKQVIAKVKSIGATDPKQAQRLSKLLELGKVNLLSEERKSAYDSRWKSVYQQPTQATQKLAASWDYSTLDQLLPSGNPDQPFDLGQFLEVAATLPESQIEADFHKLQSLLTGIEMPHVEVADKPVQSVAVTPEMLATPTAPVAGNAAKASHASVADVTKRQGKPSRPKNLAKELRRKRDRSLLLSIAGVLVSLAVVLGVVFVLLKPAQEATNPPDNTVAINPQVAPPGGNAPAAPVKPRGSGLPKVSGLETLDGLNTDASAQPIQSPMSEPPPSIPDDVPQTMVNSNEPMMPATTPPVPTEVPEAPMPQPEPEPEPTLTAADKAAWRKSMSEIRVLISKQEFEAARNRIVQAEPLVKTSEQKNQYGRLDLLLNLAEDFHIALVEAIESLGPGETFKVKSTDVSFVEGSSEKIAIRMRGTNQSYALAEMPVGLAYGLVDLKLDILHGSTLARKAAFAIVHPKSNGLVLKQAKEWMEEAIESGFAPSDMGMVFEDDYQL